MKKFIKRNIKIILGFTLGLIWSSGIAYAATILFDSDEVSYDNTTSGLSATNVQSALDELYVESTSYQLFESRVSTLESQVYPVGSVYISTTKSTTSQVASLFGGTWEAISEGRVLLGAGTNGTYTFTVGGTQSTVAGNTNTASQTITNPLGEYTHKLNTNEMPNHNHSLKDGTPNGCGGNTVTVGSTFWVPMNCNGDLGSTASAGSNYYHNNIQPYLVVYMYKRTA